VRDSFLSARAYVTEPGDFEKRLESRGIAKTKGAGQQPCSVGTDVSLQPSSQGVMPWTALNVTPHGDGETTARNEHAVRLSQSCAAVREELEALLTHHDVERVRCKGQRHGIAFTPFHGWFPSTGKREHIAVEVEPDDMSSGPYLRGSLSGDCSGAAGQIEHAFTGLRRHEIEEGRYPRSKHGGHHVTLINVGGRFRWSHLGFVIHSET
jgi:hypothetical protein